MKTIWVEILVIIAIILYPVSWVLRIIYGRQWLAWEYNLIESWGINQAAYFLSKTGLLTGIASFFLIRQKLKQKKTTPDFTNFQNYNGDERNNKYIQPYNYIALLTPLA